LSLDLPCAGSHTSRFPTSVWYSRSFLALSSSSQELPPRSKLDSALLHLARIVALYVCSVIPTSKLVCLPVPSVQFL